MSLPSTAHPARRNSWNWTSGGPPPFTINVRLVERFSTNRPILCAWASKKLPTTVRRNWWPTPLCPCAGSLVSVPTACHGATASQACPCRRARICIPHVSDLESGRVVTGLVDYGSLLSPSPTKLCERTKHSGSPSHSFPFGAYFRFHCGPETIRSPAPPL